MRLRFRFGISGLLLGTSIVALVLVNGLYAYWSYFTPDGVYQVRKEGSALLAILGEELKSGDSRQLVTSKLGPGRIIDDNESLEVIRAAIEQQPLAHSDGFQESDVFIEYSAAEGFGLHLQFRENKLVNFELPLSTRHAMRQHWYVPPRK